ncbi:MAG: hypothetical protein QOG13_942 [Sphingomonadales bacterium]|nr:hypothetical protein [Sphingomonadales bacterium]MEA3044068.1 hypothetical protein [Sphingomonadales bacterium]
MANPIKVDGKTYHHHSSIAPTDGTPSPVAANTENRQSFFKDKKAMKLDNTAGAYLPLGGRNILLVIDKSSVPPGSGEWQLVADTAARLAACYATLSPQAKTALGMLRAIVFSAKPLRSYADVRPDIFFYDTDEFRRKDRSLVSPSWTASCIVHDANHIWQHDNGKPWHGVEAEVGCWQLQIDNAASLGLTDIDVAHVNSFIADPAKIIDRATSKTFG